MDDPANKPQEQPHPPDRRSGEKPPALFKRLLPEEHRTLIQDLQVHQIELEMQNEELSRAQLELEISRQNYFDLYDLAPVGYMTLSERSLILELNLTAATLVGLDRDRLLNQPFTQLVHAEDLPLYYQKRQALFDQGGPQGYELRLLHASGEVIWVNLQATLARDRAGNAVGRISLGDITERKRAETALFQSQKLESLGILAGGMAHDFNNLLTAMLGNIELSTIDPEEGAQAKHLAVLRECVLRAAGLCRQMLAYAGKGQFIREPIRLDYLIQGHLDFMNLSVAKGVDLHLELQPGLPEIEGDAAQIEQALMNLIVNASESFGPEGGTVLIRTQPRTLQASDLAGLVPGSQVEPGPYVVLEVEDTGAGMDSATLRKIFDPFFTTKFIGRGLGLAALLGIMRVNGGAVQVRSLVGHGTCFTLWFPLAPSEHLTEPAPPACAPAPQGELQGAGRVLLVDDDEQVRAVLSLFLRHMGFEVIEAHNGEEGVTAYRQDPDQIKLVFMDITMPRMGGLEATHRILAECSQARIILMSGYAQDSIETCADRISGFLKKPFLRTELETLLAHCLEPREANS
jgi:PAS domain S-box-containing protein